MIRIGIFGYGNLGRGVEAAIKKCFKKDGKTIKKAEGKPPSAYVLWEITPSRQLPQRASSERWW